LKKEKMTAKSASKVAAARSPGFIPNQKSGTVEGRNKEGESVALCFLVPPHFSHRVL